MLTLLFEAFLYSCFPLGFWDSELVAFLLLLLMHLFPLDSRLHFLDCAHKSPRLHPEGSFSAVFLFAEFLASVTLYFELTCEFISLTLLLRSNQKVYFGLSKKNP